MDHGIHRMSGAGRASGTIYELSLIHILTAGGVPLSEVDIPSMESKKVENLYLTGELLDVDGICGGYNLHFAWATGCLLYTSRCV